MAYVVLEVVCRIIDFHGHREVVCAACPWHGVAWAEVYVEIGISSRFVEPIEWPERLNDSKGDFRMTMPILSRTLQLFPVTQSLSKLVGRKRVRNYEYS